MKKYPSQNKNSSRLTSTSFSTSANPGRSRLGRTFWIHSFFHPNLRKPEKTKIMPSRSGIDHQIRHRDDKQTGRSPYELFSPHRTITWSGPEALLSVVKTPKPSLATLETGPNPPNESERAHTEFGSQYTIITKIPESESANPP